MSTLPLLAHAPEQPLLMSTQIAEKPNFANMLAAVPRTHGVYIMRNKPGNVIYVGKSVNLRNRLRSYFSNQKKLVGKTKRLVKHIHDFEYIVAESEREALLLENSLIKQHLPRFNARLKDDKTYPYIKIDLEDDFPRVYFTRRHSKSDRAKYFGPYASAGSVRKTLDLLKKLFPYRSCTKPITGEDERPCLEFYIKRCVAPCTGQANKEQYGDVIRQVEAFLRGDTNRIVQELQNDMNTAAEKLEFERAAALRDRLQAMKIVYEDQKVIGIGNEDIDIVATAQGQNESWIDIFFIRQGNMVGRDNFIMQGTWDDTPEHIIAKFIEQFYIASNPHLPKRILTEAIPEDAKLLQQLLTDKRGSKMTIEVPQRGSKRRLLQMAHENAQEGLEQLKIKWQSNADLMTQAISELQEKLSLPDLPRRIECFDISHIQGTSSVASMSVFIDGVSAPSQYRRFQIKKVQGNDDFASMREVLSRRFKRLNQSISNDNPEHPQDQTTNQPIPPTLDNPAHPTNNNDPEHPQDQTANQHITETPPTPDNPAHTTTNDNPEDPQDQTANQHITPIPPTPDNPAQSCPSCSPNSLPPRQTPIPPIPDNPAHQTTNDNPEHPQDQTTNQHITKIPPTLDNPAHPTTSDNPEHPQDQTANQHITKIPPTPDNPAHSCPSCSPNSLPPRQTPISETSPTPENPAHSCPSCSPNSLPPRQTPIPPNPDNPAHQTTNDSFEQTPDLVLIDGGKGQLSSALEVMLHLGLAHIPIAAIAKREEEIFVPDSSEPIRIDRNAPSLFLLQRARDEAHRFAVTYHRKRRGKTSLRSALDMVPGIGPSRKRSLIRRFGSVNGIRQASEQELASTPGMTKKLASKLKEYL